MSVSTPPPPAPPKKRGMGCLGCGCLILALLAILFVGLLAGGCYVGYTKIISLTSTTPADIPNFDGGDDVYNSAEQKLIGFGHDVNDHQAAKIRLSGDEINTLIARNPDFTRQKVHLFVTLNNDEARVQGSVPTDVFLQGMLKDRYINFDTNFGVGLNSNGKSLDVFLHHLQIGDQATPDNLLPTMQAEFTPLLNAELQKYASTKNVLQQAKSIEIRDGELVIETQ